MRPRKDFRAQNSARHFFFFGKAEDRFERHARNNADAAIGIAPVQTNTMRERQSGFTSQVVGKLIEMRLIADFLKRDDIGTNRIEDLPHRRPFRKRFRPAAFEFPVRRVAIGTQVISAIHRRNANRSRRLFGNADARRLRIRKRFRFRNIKAPREEAKKYCAHRKGKRNEEILQTKTHPESIRESTKPCNRKHFGTSRQIDSITDKFVLINLLERARKHTDYTNRSLPIFETFNETKQSAESRSLKHFNLAFLTQFKIMRRLSLLSTPVKHES